MKDVHVHQLICTIGRTTRRCTTCRRVRRFIVRLYEYSTARWTCGGCGNTFSEGREHTGKRQRKRNRQRVRDEWPFAMSLKEATRSILELR